MVKVDDLIDLGVSEFTLIDTVVKIDKAQKQYLLHETELSNIEREINKIKNTKGKNLTKHYEKRDKILADVKRSKADLETQKNVLSIGKLIYMKNNGIKGVI